MDRDNNLPITDEPTAFGDKLRTLASFIRPADEPTPDELTVLGYVADA